MQKKARAVAHSDGIDTWSIVRILSSSWTIEHRADSPDVVAVHFVLQTGPRCTFEPSAKAGGLLWCCLIEEVTMCVPGHPRSGAQCEPNKVSCLHMRLRKDEPFSSVAAV